MWYRFVRFILSLTSLTFLTLVLVLGGVGMTTPVGPVPSLKPNLKTLPGCRGPVTAVTTGLGVDITTLPSTRAAPVMIAFTMRIIRGERLIARFYMASLLPW